VQATYDDNGTPKPKWVYGPADIDLDVTVLSYGAKSSKLTNADETSDLSATDDSAAVNNVLSDHGLQIQYLIRPADANDTNAWRPLYLHKQGEQAKAGEPVESGQEQTTFEETKLVPATPSYYSHGLYVENDCGERNLATCNMNVHPRTDVVSGDWSTATDFMVRACLVPVDDSGTTDRAFDDNPDHNCRWRRATVSTSSGPMASAVRARCGSAGTCTRGTRSTPAARPLTTKPPSHSARI
jgi:hypothetical protein